MEIARALSAKRPPGDHGRADGGDERRRRARAVRGDRQLRARGVSLPLRLAPPRGDLRARGHRDGPARRPSRDHAPLEGLDMDRLVVAAARPQAGDARRGPAGEPAGGDDPRGRRRPQEARRCTASACACAPARSSPSRAASAPGARELARCVAGIEQPEAGEVRLAGGARLRNPRQAIRHGIAFLPEDRKYEGVLADLDVVDNVGIGWRAAQRSMLDLPGRRRRDAAEMVARLRVKTPSLRQAVRLLSGGNQQKMLLGRWLNVGDPGARARRARRRASTSAAGSRSTASARPLRRGRGGGHLLLRLRGGPARGGSCGRAPARAGRGRAELRRDHRGAPVTLEYGTPPEGMKAA